MLEGRDQREVIAQRSPRAILHTLITFVMNIYLKDTFHNELPLDKTRSHPAIRTRVRL